MQCNLMTRVGLGKTLQMWGKKISKLVSCPLYDFFYYIFLYTSYCGQLL